LVLPLLILAFLFLPNKSTDDHDDNDDNDDVDDDDNDDSAVNFII
jgi:hypothetical protein